MNVSNVTLITTANIYFDGKVVSHTFIEADGTRKTVGVIFPGIYKFKTSCSEHMAVTRGTLHVLSGIAHGPCRTGEAFDVPSTTEFEVACTETVDYICTYKD